MSPLTVATLAAVLALDVLGLVACFALIVRRKDRGQW